MIIKKFPKKLPSKIKNKTQILENLSADESTEEHMELGWSCAGMLEISGPVVLFQNDMM